MARPRRKSSLGSDIRGDTSAPAVSTMGTTTSQVWCYPVARDPLKSIEEKEGGKPAGNGLLTASTFTLQRAASRSRRQALSKERRSSRSRARTFFTWYRELSYRNTWLNPLVVIMVALAGYAIHPSPDNPLHSAIFLSYPRPPDPTALYPDAIQYGKGLKDICFVLFYTFFFSFTRELLMQRFLRPIARYCGITKKAKVARFMEQTYTAIYFGVFCPYGLYVMYHTEVWYFRTAGYYERYPHHTHTADFKAYYLLQAAYWTQQAIVLLLQLEKPRKDFKELVLHHVVTLSLISLSYRFHFTYMGIAVFVTHDISDFFLATSKTLNYLDHPLIGPYFGFFILVWIYMRHYINLGIIISIPRQFKTIGPFFLDWEAGYYKCTLAQFISGTLLGSLQAVNLFWLWFILRIAKRFVLDNEAVDERSEDEAEADEESSNQGDEINPSIEILLPNKTNRHSATNGEAKREKVL